ncbi:MAG: DUF6788 family protein [Lentisphaeria bacterium]|jgi:hypothetical protein
MTAEESKRQLMEELSQLDNLIRGSLIHSTRKCGKKNCACASGGAGHPVCLLSTSTVNARNKMTYVSKGNEEKVSAGVAAYKRAWEIIEELSSLNVASLRSSKAKNK